MNNRNPYQYKFNQWSSHQRIAAMLSGLPREARVLDVGAASGILARSCSGRGLSIYGIEPIATRIIEARDLYTDIFLGSLEQAPHDFISGYEAVVCGDVLEHLVNPEEQLFRLVNAQPDVCIFVISVPNIANVWIRLNLLIGRFNYTEMGILDKTHLHFYTRKTFLSLLHLVGLELEALHTTPIPLELVSPYFIHNPLGRMLNNFLIFLTGIWPTLFGYQWIALARKKK